MMKKVKSKVNVIYSFDMIYGKGNDNEKYAVTGFQRTYDIEVEFSPINKTENNQLKVEKEVITQVLEYYRQSPNPLEHLDYLSMISIFYHDVTSDMVDNGGCGFIKRSNSRYYFQPDQRDLLEEVICEEFEISTKTKSYEEWLDDVSKVKVSNFKSFESLGDNIVRFDRKPRQLDSITYENLPEDLRKREC